MFAYAIVTPIAMSMGIAHALVLRCDPRTIMVCSPIGCERGNSRVYLLIDTDKKTYSRCDSKGCDTYEGIVLNTSGQFGSIQIPGRSILQKMDLETGRYTEVATLMLDVYVNHGQCKTTEESP